MNSACRRSRSATPSPAERGTAAWTVLRNYAHGLPLLPRDAAVRLRDVATEVEITERAVQRIVADREAGEYVQRERIGRGNRCPVKDKQPLRQPIEAHRTVGALIEAILVE